jgi:hypothetical protein
MMNASCSDSEHFLVLQKVGFVPRPGSVESLGCRVGKAENYRVL